MPDMRPVTSSNVKSIGHDPKTNELFVAWKDASPGKEVSIYSGVDARKADTITKAWSVTKAINSLVKEHHPHRYA